jgi:hypothetical protein
MTFEADLEALVKGAAPALGNRVFPDFAPVKTARPYSTFQQIGGQVLNQVANVAPGVRNAMVQITVWAKTRNEALEIMRAIEAAVCASNTFKAARPIAAAVADYDAEIPVYGCRQDFTFWHTN